MSKLRQHILITGPQGLGLAEGFSGAALLFFGAVLLQPLAGRPVDRHVINVARLLGARQLLQGFLIMQRPSRRTLRLGAAIDGLHTATMIAAAAADLGSRRLTIASAVTAGVLTVAGIRQTISGRHDERIGVRPCGAG